MKQFIQRNVALHREITPSLARIERLLGLPDVTTPDHVAFRTFKSRGGVSAFNPLLTTEYRAMDRYVFPEKLVTARWFQPLQPDLPRIFVSQVHDDLLTPTAQAIISEYTLKQVHGPIGAQIRPIKPCQSLPICPTVDEYAYLNRENPYAAWTLMHGTLINHVALSMCDIRSATGLRTLEELEDALEAAGEIAMLTTGGKIKVSADGLLKQSSTLADQLVYGLRTSKDENCEFKIQLIPGGFVEFVDRCRDGFEAENATHIFESTTKL